MRTTPTITIRIDKKTYEQLLELSRTSGISLKDTVAEATEALRCQMFARQVAHEFEALRNDPEAWEDYLSEAESTYVADGIVQLEGAAG